MKKDNFLKIVRYLGDISFSLLGILYALNYASVIVGRVAGLTNGTEIIYCVIPLFEIGIRYSFPAIFFISAINYFRALQSERNHEQPIENGRIL